MEKKKKSVENDMICKRKFLLKNKYLHSKDSGIRKRNTRSPPPTIKMLYGHSLHSYEPAASSTMYSDSNETGDPNKTAEREEGLDHDTSYSCMRL